MTYDAIDVFLDASEAGIRFKVVGENFRLETDYEGLKLAEAETLAEAEALRLFHAQRIKEHEDRIKELIYRRDQLERVLSMLNNHQIDQTNRDLAKRCFEKLKLLFEP